MKTQSALIGQAIDVNALLKALDFDEAQAVEAASKQPRLYFQASQLRVQFMRKRIMLQSRTDIIKARLSLQVRAELIAKGEKPIAALVSAGVLTHPDYEAHLVKLERAREKEEAAKMLVEAFRQRRDALKIVGDQNRAEFGAIRRIRDMDSLAELKAKLKRKYPGLEED